jgi:glucose dehydrogenase
MSRICAPGALIVAALATVGAGRPDSEWTVYGGGPGQERYSKLTQINPANVGRLDVAWTWDSGETGGLQTSPIIVGGVLYALTPTHRVVALDAATGSLKWKFDSGIEGRGPNRGVTYWRNAGAAEARIFAGQGTFLYALDARTGRPIDRFGTAGRVDLRENLGRDPSTQNVLLTSPGILYKDLLIVGGRVSEGLPASPGYVRAYDAQTGTLRWTFHTIPSPGEHGYETWPDQAWTYTGGANNWAGMAVDEVRGILYVPTGSASADFYGANRMGDNLFANALIALDASTGRRLWHFQSVHHDIWDRDFPSPPTLATVVRDGRRVDAVAQASKQGFVFVFDRVTGAPLFPIEERAFPGSTVDGERASLTQPVPIKPAPFARQRLTENLLTVRTPAARQAALDAFRTFQSDGQFVPFGVGTQTVVFPGFDGGAEWGGSAFDSKTGLFYVNANEMAWTGGLAPTEQGGGARDAYLRNCAACHRDDLSGAPPEIPALLSVGDRQSAASLATIIRDGAGRMPGFPGLTEASVRSLIAFLRTGRDEGSDSHDPSAVTLKYRFTGYRKFLDSDGYPAVAPPWGTLNAINLTTGDYAWTVPLGEYPELAAQGMKDTGSENYGGPIVTAGGLLFIGATNFDRKLRAFDKATGTLLWETTLPFSANATPATYEVNGRQFVVVAAGGGRSRPGTPVSSGGSYVAYALPKKSVHTY